MDPHNMLKDLCKTQKYPVAEIQNTFFHIDNQKIGFL